MKKLIITADDYGMSRAVNDAIDEGIEAGIITSTNVMTNMPYYRDAIKLKEKNVSVGIHWVLACGKPVLPKEEIPTLVMENGEFYSYKEFRKKLRRRKISYNEIKKELVAQYNLFDELMGAPDYWNTHQNTHVDFGIYRFFVDVALELGITKMRSHQRIYISTNSGLKETMPIGWRLIEPAKAKLLDFWQKNAQRKGEKSPEGLIVYLNKVSHHPLNSILSNIKWGNKEVGEYVIHPAKSNDSVHFGSIVEQRIAEYRLFTADNTMKILRDCDIELVSFDVL